MNAVILLLLLIGLNAVFAATEIAVISMNDVKLKKMAEEGNKKAVRLVALTDQPARFPGDDTGRHHSRKSAAECCSRRDFRRPYRHKTDGSRSCYFTSRVKSCGCGGNNLDTGVFYAGLRRAGS